jgi:hypothetical protein
MRGCAAMAATIPAAPSRRRGTPAGQAAQCATQPTHSGPYRAALFSVFVDTNFTKGYDSDAVVDARTVAEQAMFDEVC